MRALLTKFFALGLVGFLAFSSLPAVPANAQTQADINAAVAAAAGGNTQALAQFLAANPQAAQAVANTVATQLSLNLPSAQALANALVATGNGGLISSVMAANGLGAAAEGAVSRSLVSSRNVTLIATIEANLKAMGATGALAILTAQVAASSLVVPTLVGGLPLAVPPVAVISPAQTKPQCSGSCS